MKVGPFRSLGRSFMLVAVLTFAASNGRAQFVWDGTTALAATSLGGNTLGSGATLAITTGNNHDFNGLALVNNGTVTWSAGYLRGGNGSTFANNGTFNDQNSSGYSIHNPSFNGTAGTFVFTNNGTYTRTVTGTTTISATFDNPGAVNVSGGGRLTLSGGGTSGGSFSVTGTGSDLVFGASYTLTTGATTSGAVRVTAGTFTANGSIAVNGFSFEGGSLQGTQTFTGGNVSWIGGDWNAASATTTIANSATLTMGNGANHDFNQRAIVNNGTVTWLNGYLRGGNGSTFLNNGTFTDQNASSYTVHNPSFNGTAGTFTFTNNGTYLRNAGGTTYFDVPFDNNATVTVSQGDLWFRAGGTMASTGTISAASGTNVYFANGYTIATGVSLTGAGTYWLTGGTLTLPGTLNVSTLNQTGGTLAGTNVLHGTINWSGGDWNTAAVGATTTIDNGAVLNLGNGANHDFNQRGIVNNGTVNWTNGYIRGGNGSTFLNNGTFNDQNASSYTVHNPGFNGTTGAFGFTNNGTYVRNAGGTTYFDVPFDNNGTVTVTQGDLQFRAGGTLASAGTISAASGANVYFTSGYVVNNGSSLTGLGTFWLTGGTLSLTGQINVGTFNQTAGSLGGGGTINGTFNWNGGDWNGTTSLAIASTGIVNLGAGANHDLNQRPLTNNGIFNWTSGYIRGGNGSTFINVGTFNDQNSSSYTIHNPGFNGTTGTFTFTNNGTYNRNTGGTTYFDVPFDNNATVNLQQGDIQIRQGGTMSATSVVNVSSGAHLYFTNNYTLLDGAQFLGAGLMNQTAGTLTLNGQLRASAFLWSGGNWNAANNSGLTTTIAAGTTLNLSNANDSNRDFNGRAIVNNGTVNWATGYLRGGNGSTFTNAGTFNDQNSASYTIHNPTFNGSAGTFVFTNNGTYIRNTGGTTYFDTTFNNNATVNLQQGDIQLRQGGTMSATSVVNVSSGAHLYFTNSYTLLDGAQFLGAGLMNQTAGTLTLNGQLRASAFLWSGGDWNTANNSGLTTTIAAGTILNLSNANDSFRDFNGRALVNNGTVNWATGYLRGGNGSTFTNVGTFNDQNSSSYTIYNPTFGGTAGTFTFINNGTYVRNTGGTTYFDTTFNNNATVNLQQGDIQLRAGGAMSATSIVNAASGAHLYFANNYTLLDGAQFTGAGLFNQVAGTLTVDGALTASNFLWSGGNWNAANNSGLTTTIAAGTTLNLSNANDSNRDFNGRTLTNSGTINWSTGYLRSGNGGAFINQVGGVFNDTNASGYSIYNPSFGGSAGTFSFTNSGTYNRTGGGTTFIQVPFTNNNGLVISAVGVLRFQSTFTHTAGVLSVSNGGTLQFDNNLTLAAGALIGNGTVIGNVDSSGTVSPSATGPRNSGSTGILGLTGDLTLASTAKLFFELGGTTAGTGYDQLNVTGAAALGGSLLNVSFINGFQSTVTSRDSFTVFTASSISGAFANVGNGARLFTMDGLGSFTVNYGAGSAFATNNLVLNNFVPVPEPSTWALLVAGLGALGLASRRKKF